MIRGVYEGFLPESTKNDSVFEMNLLPCRKSKLCRRLDLYSHMRCSKALRRMTEMKISLSEHSNQSSVF